MKNYRKLIEGVKGEFRQQIDRDAAVYKRAIIREISSLFRSFKQQYPDYNNIGEFADFALNKLRVPLAFQNGIISELKDSQRQIASIYDDYFHDLTPAPLLRKERGMQLYYEYDKLVAAYQVSFPQINKELKNAVESEVRRAVRADYGYEAIRKRLLDRNVGEANAKTLANTAVAQFDNAYMFENAQQSGIDHFFYSGVLHENSRRFCREQLLLAQEGKVYTVEQINKLDNHQGLPVLTSCGGYNCTHWWEMVVK